MDIVLGEFMDLAPACAQTDSLTTVLECFGQKQCEQIVIIDAQRQPLGLLRLSTLLPWIGSTTNWREYSIQDLMMTAAPLQLEPLMRLWLHHRLEQFWPDLFDLQRHQYGLVDNAGRYQGLLDRLQLLQFLITHPIKPIAPIAPNFTQIGEMSLANAEVGDRGSRLSITPLSDLIKLLEQLPLPLMLQTSTGQVVSQNQTWQQQVGELQDPQEIRQAAAVWLRRTIDPDLSLSPWQPESDPVDSANFCYGSDVNSCVCVCPMKNGQEQVWKFLKIPLDISADWVDALTERGSFLSEELVREAATEYCSLSEAPSRAVFQLATLELASSLPWLGKTETLPAMLDPLWLILAQDTTEQQQIAKELTAKNADLIQLNRLKDEFLDCISHELKTPLTAILGLSSLLKDNSLGTLNDRQTRYARMIHQSGRHLVLIVNNILDLTRMETGQLDLMPEMVGLEDICTSAYEQARQAHKIAVDEVAATTPISSEPLFSLEIEPGVEQLIVDQLRLRQMLSNLLSNALKFTDVSGKIGLEVEQWESWIALTVWDTGIGIPTNKQHLIFQKFQRFDNPLAQQFEGTGLGLVLTRRLAQLHGGEVTFTSIEGQGSRFTLLLPPSPPQDDRGDRLPKSTLPAARLVLVVEAVPQFLEKLTQHLNDFGYRVVIARSGQEALEKTRRLRPTAVFLNPTLPLLSGWDLLTLIKSEPEICHIPVIVMTTQIKKTQAFHNGADGFISLPVQPEVLRQTLDRLIYAQSAQTIHPLSQLTVLHLLVNNTAAWNGDAIDQATASAPPVDLHTLLHPYHRRILEVDDLEQADLLARIWKPNVLLLEGSLADPIAYLNQLSQRPFLASLPLVTLTPEITQAANQTGKLAVFPCLANANSASERDTGEPPALLQVLKVASEVNWIPHILLVDLGALPDSIAETEWEGITTSAKSTDESTIAFSRVKPEAEWLQATAQSLRMAGIRSSVTDSWSQVMHHLHHQSVNLLLLRTEQNQPHPSVLRVLQTLIQLEHKPPILVWQDDLPELADDPFEHTAYRKLLRAIATQFLSPSLSMKDLLEQINRNLPRP